MTVSTSSSNGRVMIALNDDPLEWSATWTCVEHGRPNLVSGFDIRSGRQTEFDTTDTASAIVYLHDRHGYFDPANGASPFADYDGRQIVLQVWNPITSSWSRQFRGHIDDVTFEHNPATRDGESIVSNVQLVCVGIIDWIGRIELELGRHGDPLPTGVDDSVVFYEDTAPGDDGMQVRVTQVLDECDIPVDWYVVFTGNVALLEGRYDAGDSALLPIRDALDAEFPGIANGYEDRFGRFCAHGRRARFDPDTVAAGAGDDTWRFRRWKCGDGAAIAADATDRAQIRPPFRLSRPRNRVVNVGFAYPADIAEADKSGQYVVAGGSSIARYGRRPWRAERLLVKSGTTTGNSGNDEAKLYASWRVANYADPQQRIEAVTVKSIRPTHRQAAPTWALLTEADISDVLGVKVGYPGGTQLSEDFYIEGRELTCRRANPDYDLVSVTYNVSPTAYYGDDVGMLG